MRKRIKLSRSVGLPLIVASIAVAISLVCAHEIRKAQSDRLASDVRAYADVFATKLQERLIARLDIAGLLKDAVLNRSGPLGPTFKAFAGPLHDRTSEIQSLNWVGPEGVIRIVTPLGPNRAALGLDISALPVPAAILQAARTDRALRATPPLTLAQGGRGFAAYLPVFEDRRLLGYTSVVFRAAPLVESIVRQSGNPFFTVSIRDGDALVWEGDSASNAPMYSSSLPVAVGGRTWTLTVAPTAAGLAAAKSLLDEIVFAFGMVAALILAGTIREVARNRAILIDREERFDLAMQGATDGLFDWSAETGETYYSPRWFQMLGYEPGELEPGLHTFLSLLHPEDEPEIRKRRMEDAVVDDFIEEEFRMMHKSGHYVHIMSRATVLRANGEVKRIVGTHVDITELRKQQQELEVAARTDELTGLRNRRGLPEDLNILSGKLDDDQRLAVFHLDLDMFKAINDTRGHDAGDFALTTTAQRLRRDPAQFDVIARVGGDEFLLARRVSGPDDKVRRIADETILQISEPFDYQGGVLSIGASIGIAFLENRTLSDVEAVIANADIALNAAKKLGRGRSLVFTDGMAKDTLYAAGLSIEIEEALRRDQFIAHYQPQVDIETGAIIGLEALARWNNPHRGFLSGGAFVPYAESSNLIKEIDHTVLNHACRLARRLPQMGLDTTDISVNMSTSQLMDPDVVGRFVRTAADHGVPLRKLRVELLESTLLSERTENVAENIRRFAELGVQMDLDDFGTGHAAISSLLNFPISRVKLDRSLVTNIQNDPRRQTITKAIIEMCNSLSVEILAEGIETEAELKFLRTAGCALAQGYFIAAPMSDADLAAFADTAGRDQMRKSA